MQVRLEGEHRGCFTQALCGFLLDTVLPAVFCCLCRARWGKSPHQALVVAHLVCKGKVVVVCSHLGL